MLERLANLSFFATPHISRKARVAMGGRAGRRWWRLRRPRGAVASVSLPEAYGNHFQLWPRPSYDAQRPLGNLAGRPVG
jgi:hypothetical protein